MFFLRCNTLIRRTLHILTPKFLKSLIRLIKTTIQIIQSNFLLSLVYVHLRVFYVLFDVLGFWHVGLLDFYVVLVWLELLDDVLNGDLLVILGGGCYLGGCCLLGDYLVLRLILDYLGSLMLVLE
jgi:hypothetical protein